MYRQQLAPPSTQPCTHLCVRSCRKRGVHLTNYSLGKRSAPALPNQSPHESDSAGCKWSLSALREHLTAEGRVCWRDVWQQVGEGSKEKALQASCVPQRSEMSSDADFRERSCTPQWSEMLVTLIFVKMAFPNHPIFFWCKVNEFHGSRTSRTTAVWCLTWLTARRMEGRVC